MKWGSYVRLLVMSLGLCVPEIVLAQAVAVDSPRTSWGQPDLQGVWDFRTATPLERPEELAGKEVLSDEEAAAV